MTLKHTNKAKWARKQHSREHRDPAVSVPAGLVFFQSCMCVCVSPSDSASLDGAPPEEDTVERKAPASARG